MAASPPPRLEDPARTLAGVWQGVITGRDMATVNGLMSAPATLTIAPDGTWTMSAGGGRITGSLAVTPGQARPDVLILSGRIEPGTGPTSAPAEFCLWRLGDRGLVGSGPSFFLGLEIWGQIELQRVP